MVVVFALSTCVSTLVGGLVALRNRDRMHLILGFTAGVLLGLVAFDLLPEVFALSESHTAGVPTVMLTFAGGFLGRPGLGAGAVRTQLHGRVGDRTGVSGRYGYRARGGHRGRRP